MTIYQGAGANHRIFPHYDTIGGSVAIFADDTGAHSDVCAVFNGNGIMSLVFSVAGKINAVGNGYVIADGDLIVAQIIQIGFHTDKNLFSDAETTNFI